MQSPSWCAGSADSSPYLCRLPLRVFPGRVWILRSLSSGVQVPLIVLTCVAFLYICFLEQSQSCSLSSGVQGPLVGHLTCVAWHSVNPGAALSFVCNVC